MATFGVTDAKNTPLKAVYFIGVRLKNFARGCDMKRKILDEVLSQRPTGPLYHYTQQAGFMGIIGSAKIWATHTQYLNDLREYLHAVDMVRDQIRAIRAFGDSRLHPILQGMEEGLDGIENINVCVCSFSEERDSLSQWRAYGASPSSFSIGFSGTSIGDVADREDWFLAPCIYDSKKQNDLISALVQEVIEENIVRAQSGKKEELMQIPGASLNAYLHRYAPLLKDYSFREEREWRLISRPQRCTSEAFAFREGNSMLIPYYKLRLGAEPAALNIHEVVVGPTPHPVQASASARSFLLSHSLRNVPVVPSQVPYRSW